MFFPSVDQGADQRDAGVSVLRQFDSGIQSLYGEPVFEQLDPQDALLGLQTLRVDHEIESGKPEIGRVGDGAHRLAVVAESLLERISLLEFEGNFGHLQQVVHVPFEPAREHDPVLLGFLCIQHFSM